MKILLLLILSIQLTSSKLGRRLLMDGEEVSDGEVDHEKNQATSRENWMNEMKEFNAAMRDEKSFLPSAYHISLSDGDEVESVDKMEPEITKRMAKGRFRTSMGGHYLDVHQIPKTGEDGEEEELDPEIFPSVVQDLLECKADTKCRPDLQYNGIYPVVKFTHPEIVRARWKRVCQSPFPCGKIKPDVGSVCLPFGKDDTCEDGTTLHGVIPFEDPELLIKDVQPAIVSTDNPATTLSWRDVFRKINRGTHHMPATIQEALDMLGGDSGLAMQGYQVKRKTTYMWRSRYEMCVLQGEGSRNRVRQFFEWLYGEEICSLPTPCKVRQNAILSEMQTHESTIFDRCWGSVVGAAATTCPKGSTYDDPEKYCDMSHNIPDMLSMDIAESKEEGESTTMPEKSVDAEKSEDAESEAVESEDDLSESTKKAQEEERKKDAALYTSLQRFRLRDIREEVDGSFSYEIRRMGVTTWVSHKKMCKTSPESVWLFYRYKGALICEGTRPCKDTLNSLCVSKQTKVLSSAGFVDAKGNPTNEANRAVCPDRTLQGIQQVCDPKSKPPTLPKSLFDDDDDDSSSSSTSERRAAYARSVRLRKRREHILQPRPTTAQYDPYPSSNPDCPQLRSLIVQVDGSGASVPQGVSSSKVAKHLTRFTGMWDTHTDSTMTMVQIYAASRMPLRMPRRHFLAGLDGRAEFALSGAAGGEIGELVVAVLALERARAEVLSAFTQNDEIEEKSTVRVNLDRDEIRALVVSYVKWLHSSGAQKFYMGTDSITIRRWAAAAGAPVNLLSHGDALSSAMETSESAVASIPLDVRERMVRLCTRPEYVGDSHLRAMLTSPEQYLTRKAVVEEIIRAFVGLYLGTLIPDDKMDVASPVSSSSSVTAVPGSASDILRSQLVLGILSGYHKESGLIRVFSPEIELCGGAAPLVVRHLKSTINQSQNYHLRELYIPFPNKQVPSVTGPFSSYFVIHPSAIQARRKQLSEFLVNVMKFPSTDLSETLKMNPRLGYFAALDTMEKSENVVVDSSLVLRHALAIGTHQLEVTLDRLDVGPRYSVFFTNGEYYIKDSTGSAVGLDWLASLS